MNVAKMQPEPEPAPDLRLDADFDDAAGDGEDVADDEEDEPAVNELQAVGPGHRAVQVLLKVAHILLRSRSRTA